MIVNYMCVRNRMKMSDVICKTEMTSKIQNIENLFSASFCKSVFKTDFGGLGTVFSLSHSQFI